MSPLSIRMKPAAFILFSMCLLCLSTFYYYHFSHNKAEERGATISIKKLLVASLDLIKEAGNKIVEIKSSQHLNIYKKTVGKKKEAAIELLTTADLASHKIIKYGLVLTFPGLRVISEEHDESGIDKEMVYLPNENYGLSGPGDDDDDEIPLSDVLVWIDPLDATQEYTENMTNFVTSMICVARKGQPIMGVVHSAFKKRTYWAYTTTSGSYFMSWQPMKAVKSRSGEIPKILVSRSHAGDVEKLIHQKFDNQFEVLPAGGSGFKTMEVLEGRAAAYLHNTAIKKWDICAPDALARISGSKMTDLDNNFIDYSDPETFINTKGILVSNGNVTNQLTHEGFLRALNNE